MIDLTHSLDDTLRSTSPMPVNEQVPLSPPKADNSLDKSQSSAERPSLILRSNSYTLDKPSVALLIAERVRVTLCDSLILKTFVVEGHGAHGKLLKPDLQAVFISRQTEEHQKLQVQSLYHVQRDQRKHLPHITEWMPSVKAAQLQNIKVHVVLIT